MAKTFEELTLWQDSKSLVLEIYKLTANIKDYGFKDQIQRAAVSIMNNIAEGFESGSDIMFVKYLNTAKGSAGEVRSMLYLMIELKYADEDNAKKIIDSLKNISSQIYKLISYLKK
ncbi:MAG: four helix bundle protein [Bacteroidales bacterium]|nr:four helix bundle protein [Bacteroidales bacterium]